MSNNNSAISYKEATVQELAEALSFPLFSGAEGQGWSFTLNGLLLQGNKLSITSPSIAVPFIEKFPLQVLGVFTQIINPNHGSCVISSVNLQGFTAHAQTNVDIYWWAIGV